MYFNDVAAAASNDVWAVGYQGVGLAINTLIEHWDGTSWSIVSSPAFTGVGPIYGISADASNDVWAVGGNKSLHFDGTSWSLVAGVYDRQHDRGHGRSLRPMSGP